jgi:hypothetical protein
MGSKEVKNFKHAVSLAMTQPELGCPILDLYYNSPSESIRQYVTFIKCNYCYKVCKMPYSECLESIRYLYYNNYITLSEFRTVLGRFIALKRKGYLS